VLPQHHDQKQLNPRNSLFTNSLRINNSHSNPNTHHQLHLTIVQDVEAVITLLLVAVERVVMTVGIQFNKAVQVWVKA
jgi:hypothetical protein